jgi:FMN-dependent oxidoreductase (nitrilotriacetate monooxygenase family)
MKRAGQMSLGTFVYAYGFNPASWRHPGSPVDGSTNFAHMLNIARLSEEAALDFLFLADSPAAAVGAPAALGRLPHKMNRFEPLTLLSALAVSTRSLGLAATLSTSFYEPYNVARLFGSLDHLSGGRACWNVVTSDHDETGFNYGFDGLPPHAERYARAEEFADICFGLWDGWERDALVLDRASGLYHDHAKVHTLDHRGPHFKVRGPLNLSRSPQGRPVIAQAGGSPAGIELAARTADIVFGLASDFEKSKAFYERLKARMAHFGRARDQLKVMPGIMVTVGRTTAEAQAKIDFLNEMLHPAVGLQMLAEFLEADLADVALDEPFPEHRLPKAPKGSRALWDTLVTFVRQGLTVRELIRIYGERQTGNGITGTPTQIADFMQEWFEGGAADGFILLFPTLPSSLQDFTELVVPELRRRGLFRAGYRGVTLRDHLGLAQPHGRFDGA